jgi:2-oxoisovalerate dehydrogenase E1 component alpha subunit
MESHPHRAAQDGPVQLLDSGGSLVAHPDYEVELSPEEIRSAYRDLVTVRQIDLAAAALARQGELGLWPPVIGQEAAQVGSALALDPGDMAFPTYRELGVAWCRGVDLLRVLALFRGVDHGGWDPRAHGCHPYTIVVGSHALHATGYAMGIQRDHSADAAIAYFGDGATAQGDVNEAFVWASVFTAPVVFYCQNNQWAISQPVGRQSRAPIWKRAEGFGFPGVQVDGNDLLACHAVTRRALAEARSGQGPTLIEACTYRMGPHTTTDDPGRYRSQLELDEWQHKDPIARVRAYLIGSQLADEAFAEQVEAEAEQTAADLRQRCLDLPDPGPAQIFEHIYGEPHRLLDEESAKLAAFAASFAEDR